MLRIIALITSLLFSSTQAFALCTAPQWVLGTDPPPASLVQYVTFYSPALGANASYGIYLPREYDLNPSRRFPVLYWLHGGGSNLTSGEDFVNLLDDAIARGVSPPFIVVQPNGPETMWTNSNPGLTPYDAPIETMIINELIPLIDSTYRTIATRGGRGIEGFSMGGRGSSRLGLKYPVQFGLVSNLAGAVGRIEFWQNYTKEPVYTCVFGNDATYFNATDPFTHASTNAGLIQSLGPYYFRIVVGDQDGRGTYEFNLDFGDHLTALAIDHTLVVVPGVTHSYQNLYSAQGDSMFTFFADAWGGVGNGDTTPPTTPKRVEAVALNGGRAALTWDAARDDHGVVSYEIYRDGILIATVSGLTFEDGGLRPRVSYSYSLCAVDAAGNESAMSRTVHVTAKR